MKINIGVWWYRFKCWITGKPTKWIDKQEFDLYNKFTCGIDPYEKDTSSLGSVTIHSQYYHTTYTTEKTKVDKHICKYCGIETTEPDEYCYRNPNPQPEL